MSIYNKMPLFGKKSDKSKSPTSPSGSKDEPGSLAASGSKKGKAITVEDKYILKDVLGT